MTRTGLDERSWAMVVCGGLSVVLVGIVSLLPIPFGTIRPGPVENVLGEVAGTPVITISGRRTYPTEGSLGLLTVGTTGGPGAAMTMWELVAGWADPDVDVRPDTELFDLGSTAEENRQQNVQEMESSQESATVAALQELGIEVPATLTVSGVSPGSRAEGVLRPRDVVLAVNGHPVTAPPDIRAQLDLVQPGDQVGVRVSREGTEQDVHVQTIADPSGDLALLGVYIDPAYRLPFEVEIRIDDVGGPSAGMIFALGIIDMLTPGPMTGGRMVVGTGTMSSTGEVGAIGGVRQKMVSARAEGAEWFLAPADNCAEIVGRVPPGLRVVRVENLAQARAAAQAIGSDAQAAAALPGCG